MTKLRMVSTALALTVATSGPALAHGELCSLNSLAGQWIFATEVGHQNLGAPLPPDKDITAIGTMDIDEYGNIEGVFDATVQDHGLLPGISYSGTLVLDRGCIGTLTFVTSWGSVRVDTVAVLSRRELRGMSQDPANLWTYDVRRIGPSRSAFR